MNHARRDRSDRTPLIHPLPQIPLRPMRTRRYVSWHSTRRRGGCYVRNDNSWNPPALRMNPHVIGTHVPS